MKKTLLLSALAALLLCTPAVQAKDTSLAVNGTGLRTKMILGAMYELSLMVPEALKGAEARDLIDADKPMELILIIKSRLINRARFVEATSEGFAKAAKSGYATAQQEAFLKQFDDTVFRRGDAIEMCYNSKGLTTTYQKLEGTKDGADMYAETVLGTIPGLDLKKALFAIWLGDTPVQASLKKALLGTP